MKFLSKLQLLVTLCAPALFLAACNGSQQAPPTLFTIGGQVVNLAGNGGGLILQDNGTDNLMVNANGSFQFATPVPSGGAYHVTVFSQPSNPAQTCAVTKASGNATANVMTVAVDCGHNEWTWMAGSQTIDQRSTNGTMGVAAPGNTPGGRQYAATWTDSSGTLWLFGGYGHDSSNVLLPMSDLWKFSGGQWTWVGGPTLGGQNGVYGTMGTAAPTNIPGARFEAASWTDKSGDFWLFGGNGFDSVGNESPMNDLWKYSVSTGQWAWMGGSSVGLQQSNYGTLGVANPANTPGGRASTVMWLDSAGSVWIFGGLGYDESNPINGELNDLWKYSGGVWTWMGGSKTKQQNGVYGTQGVAAASNIAGARLGAYGWSDTAGNFWLFGGFAYDSNGVLYPINDQWKYSGGEWTWVAGAKVTSQAGVYGTQGVAAASNIPGARQYGVTWTDASGNAWLFGGNGFDANGQAGMLNDLWIYSGGEWTWVAGSKVSNPTSVFGTQGMPFPGNTPGGRFFLSRWADSKGNLWLFGGYGPASGVGGNLNDLWQYLP